MMQCEGLVLSFARYHTVSVIFIMDDTSLEMFEMFETLLQKTVE